MSTVEIKIINYSQNALPAYASASAAGLDIRAHLPAPMAMKPMERTLVPTGLFMEIPDGYEGQIRPRSGLAFKQGITCLNTPGTIDSDYRGEIKVLLINLSTEQQIIEPGDRIAQLVVQKVEHAVILEANELSITERGAGGFGSTGKK